MPRVVHFEIHAQDPARAVRFYAQVFGWSAQRWGSEEYWLLTTSPPQSGASTAPSSRAGATRPPRARR